MKLISLCKEKTRTVLHDYLQPMCIFENYDIQTNSIKNVKFGKNCKIIEHDSNVHMLALELRDNGKLKEIRRYDFTNELQYYNAIIKLKQETQNIYEQMQNSTYKTEDSSIDLMIHSNKNNSDKTWIDRK